MKIKIYQIDTFTDHVFAGNPAAVCPLPKGWLSNETMQNIALENNLAETAFYIHEKNQYHIRWFTPTVEVDLCGHATLASGYVLFNHEGYKKNEIVFHSRSGELQVKKTNDILTLNFPTDRIEKSSMTDDLAACFNFTPKEIIKGKTDYMLVFENEDQIAHIQFDLLKIKKIKARGIIITAPGNHVDFVSRFFAPQSGIDEDPVTGSAHTTLTPYWSHRLNKIELSAKQLSPRGGILHCKYLNERVDISGKATLYMHGEIYV